MRTPLNIERLNAVVASIGRLTPGAGRIYLVGGSTALLLGFRETTVDLDLKIDPEPQGVFEAIAQVKESLQANIELSSPDQFIPELPGWRERSVWIAKHGQIDFYHYDYYSQALAKIARGFDRDLRDAAMLLKSGRISEPELLRLFEVITPAMVRFPNINPKVFRSKLDSFIGSVRR
jgi:hypothetical protein